MMMSIGEHVFFMKVCCSQWTDAERMLEDNDFYPAASVMDLLQATCPEDSDAFRSIVERLITHKKFDIANNGTLALHWAVEYGRLYLVERLMQSKHVDSSFPLHWPIISACEHAEESLKKCSADLTKTRLAIVDALYRKNCGALPFERLSFAHIGMFRTRMLHVCMALESLRLPDLHLLKIINFLIPNTVVRWQKIQIIHTVRRLKLTNQY